jgi:probable F420-dependent oxidoreductase
MKITGTLGEGPVTELKDSVRLAVEVGVERIWTADLAHDPFLTLGMVSAEEQTMPVGTCVAIAFGRTPWAMAQAGWDMANLSGGRFILGLGTQVKAHIERRFGGTWQAPAPYMREYVQAVREIWRHWTEGGPLNYRGERFNLTLTAPPFHAEKGGTPPPIYMGGVNSIMCRVAGEVADGFITHGFNSRAYITDRVMPELFRDRDRDSLQIVVPVMLGASVDAAGVSAAREAARAQIGFYASTPAYRTILEAEGYGELGDRFSQLAREQNWKALAEAVDDEMLDKYAICGTVEEAGAEMARRYDGVADELLIQTGLKSSDPAWWHGLRAGFDSVAVK